MQLNPKLVLESNLFRSTVLTPDFNVFFPNKDSLKKKGVFLLYRPQLIYGISIAASIIILLGFYFGFVNQPTKNNKLSDLNKIEIIQPEILATETPISEIQQKENVYANRSVIRPAIEPDFMERENLAIVEMDITKINFIKLNENGQASDLFIEARQTPANFIEYANNTDPTIADPKPKKSFIKRFIAGISKKLIDVDRPEKKSFFEYTIDGYNFIADKEVAVDKELDENGKVVAYKVNGENLSLSRASRNGTIE
jgi:hypothetical protein